MSCADDTRDNFLNNFAGQLWLILPGETQGPQSI